MNVFNFISGLASIGGAFFSFWQAWKARQSAIQAKNVEDNIKHHRTTSDVAKLKEKAEYLISQISIYGHGGNTIKYSTANHDKNFELIQEFVLRVQEYQGCFNGKTKKEIEALIGDIEVELSSFNTTNILDEDRKESGRKILSKVNMLNSKFKSILDNKIGHGK